MLEGDARPGGPQRLDELLALVTFQPAPEPHIALEAARCRDCGIGRVCLSVCPAGNYRLEEASQAVVVACESCMECGACRIACTEGAISWRWPRGGCGLCYREA